MRWYESLTALGLKKSYAQKFLLVAFLGIHVPLIVLLVYLLATHQLRDGAWIVALVVLLATLGGTAATLAIQYHLLEPIRRTEVALEAYRKHRRMPALPEHFTDEIGRVMGRVQATLTQLDAMVREKEKVMSSLAQDLRSPLSSIVSAVKLVSETESNPDNRALLETIRDTAARELNQIDDVLLAARMDADELELRKTLIDTGSILNEVRRNTQFTARERLVMLQIEAPETQGYVNADRARIVQALNNLVLFALKSSVPHGVAGLKTEIEKDRCRFILQYEGAGGEKTGPGLGMRIATQLIRLHGSEVKTEELGPDTRISFSIGTT